MSSDFVPSLQTLPVELLHRIFDHLDIHTILFSLRQVCRFFRAVINTYDRYVLDFKSISKSEFNVICRLIHPQNVISIIYAGDDKRPGQIDHFLSITRIRQFTRLRLLTLPKNDESHLDIILKRININSLTSFTLNIEKYDDRRRKTTGNLLSSVVAQPNLHKLDLNITYDRFKRIQWSNNCAIRHLIVNEHMTFDYLCNIFRCSPHLRTLVIREDSEHIMDNTTSTTLLPLFRQLTSLTIEESDFEIDKLEWFLSLTPSLAHLKLIGSESSLDGNRWEQFIQTNLPLLDKFEFFFHCWRPLNQQSPNLDPICASFRTPFWLEYKKWFVTCNDRRNYFDHISVYTIPVCKSSLTYEPHFLTSQITTSAATTTNDTSDMDHVDTISLNLNKTMTNHIQQRETTTSRPLFRKATKLNVDLSDGLSPASLQTLSTLIDLSQLVHIKLVSHYFHQYKLDILTSIGNFIQRASNISSLTIYSNSYRHKGYPTPEHLCLLVPRHIKHLHVTVTSLDGFKMILKRCPCLSSVQLNIRYSKGYQQIVNWLEQNTLNSTHRKDSRTLIVWLGRIQILPDDDTINHKRFKEIDENQAF